MSEEVGVTHPKQRHGGTGMINHPWVAISVIHAAANQVARMSNRLPMALIGENREHMLNTKYI